MPSPQYSNKSTKNSLANKSSRLRGRSTSPAASSQEHTIELEKDWEILLEEEEEEEENEMPEVDGFLMVWMYVTRSKSLVQSRSTADT